MTAPICHGAAGGCRSTLALTVHTLDCPTYQGPAFLTPPTKRAMGQCTEECQTRQQQPRSGIGGHLIDCPALYPLQRQPGDEKDALTRLTAHCRTAEAATSFATWEDVALDLISEAREEHRRADAQRALEWKAERAGRNALGERVIDLEKQRDWARSEVERLRDGVRTTHDTVTDLGADLARAKALITTLTLQQSEVRQQALRDMAAEMIDMTPDERYLHLARLLDAAKEPTS